MGLRTLLAAGALVVLAQGVTAQGANAQEWRAGAQYGRLQGDGAVGSTSEATLVLGLMRLGVTDALVLSGAVPIEGSPAWATVSAWKRIAKPGAAGFGVDASVHGFVQRETYTVEQAPGPGLPGLPRPQPSPTFTTVEETVRGGGGQGALLAFADVSGVHLEARGGVAGRTISAAGLTESRAMATVDGRAVLHAGILRLEPEVQHWGGKATWAGGTARASLGRVDGWASAGQWLQGGIADPVVGAGIGVEAGRGLRLEAAYRSPRYEPLYESALEATLSIGASMRLNGRGAYAAPVPASYRDGRAVIRLSARDARGTGAPRVAGDFSDWKPVAMVREGAAWIASVPVEPGVYHYAFVSEDGEWFVPASTPGRRSDGMGGEVAVLVVTR